MAEKGSFWLLLERQIKPVSRRVRGSCNREHDLEMNILSSERKEAQAVRAWLNA